MLEDAIGPQKVVFDVKPEIIQAAKQRLADTDELFSTKASG